jgi:uncharacterized FlaG/YvyC family protein
MDPISLIPQLDPTIKANLDPTRPASTSKTSDSSDAAASAAIPSESQLSQVASMIENSLADHNLRLHFSMDESKDRIIIQVIDDTKGEVIRTIPPEEFFKNASSGGNVGLLVDQSG